MPILFLTACGIVVRLTESKSLKGQVVESPASIEANDYFWSQLHNGNYDSIPEVIEKLNVALSENPNDAIAISHLGFAHVWALAERQRIKKASPLISEHIYLAKRYFEEANKLNPNDPRVAGFLADLNIVEGTYLKDKQQIVKGYFQGLKAIKMWPQFNQFTLGYVLSTLDTVDVNFQKAIDWQYKTIADCACEKVKKGGDYEGAVKKIKTAKDQKILRACWNSWMVPHNWEGFCINFGDMVTKSGDLEEAVRIYELAKLSDNFHEWPFKELLEQRILNISTNYKKFNEPIEENRLNEQSVVLFNSKNSCIICHQMSEGDRMGFVKPSELNYKYYFQKKGHY